MGGPIPVNAYNPSLPAMYSPAQGSGAYSSNSSASSNSSTRDGSANFNNNYSNYHTAGSGSVNYGSYSSYGGRGQQSVNPMGNNMNGRVQMGGNTAYNQSTGVGRAIGAGYPSQSSAPIMNMRQPWRGPGASNQTMGAPSNSYNSSREYGYPQSQSMGGQFSLPSQQQQQQLSYGSTSGGYGNSYGGGVNGGNAGGFFYGNNAADDLDAYSAQGSANSVHSGSGLDPAGAAASIAAESSVGSTSFLSTLRGGGSNGNASHFMSLDVTGPLGSGVGLFGGESNTLGDATLPPGFGAKAGVMAIGTDRSVRPPGLGGALDSSVRLSGSAPSYFPSQGGQNFPPYGLPSSADSAAMPPSLDFPSYGGYSNSNSNAI